MRVWLIKLGEPLPIDSGCPRLLRTGMLAEALASRGHEVLWWTSTVDHGRKLQRFARDTFCDVHGRYRLCVLRAPLYKRNTSPIRMLSHRLCARSFFRIAAKEAAPDLIVASLPTIELCAAAVRYGCKRSVPVALDMRDMWPDIILETTPWWTRPIVRLALTPMYRDMRYACRNATAILGITPEFVDWGLCYAGRTHGPLDVSFPHAYTPQPLSDDVKTKALEFWRRHGVDGSTGLFTACFFGTMGTQFEIQTVIEAARQLQGSGSRFRLVLGGTGDRLAEYQRLAHDLDNVVFPGWLGAAEMLTLMDMSSVALAPYESSPSFVISWPSKIMQYLSAGLPIISSLGGSLERLLREEHCGLTYPNKDSKVLASILLDLSRDDAKRTQMARNALQLHRSRFTAEIVFKQMVDHLEAITNNHSAVSRFGHIQAS